jgi:hypothetical protein
MQQKTKNHQSQGSVDKKFDFFPQSLSHIPRWVLLVQKTRAKNSHAWAPLSKLSIAQSSRKFCEWHTPHPPVATLGPEPANFQKNPPICGKSGGFEKKVADLRQIEGKRSLFIPQI